MRFLTVLALMLCLGTAVPVLNAVSPYSASYQAKVPPSGLSNALVITAAGCGSPDSSGQYNCTGGLTPTSNSGFFSSLGSALNSLLVFGNFFAAAQFLVTLTAGVVLPGAYVLEWLGGAGNIGALAMAAMVQGLIWISYAEGLMYIISGRWLE